MSRMHNSKRGRSGSTPPVHKETPDWVDMDEEEIKEKVAELYQQGNSPGEIGIMMRDQHGIPDVDEVVGMSVTDILEDDGIYQDIPQDLIDLMERAVNLHEHLEENPKDKKNRRGMQLVESKIRRLAEYYREQGELEEDWKYSLNEAEMLTQ